MGPDFKTCLLLTGLLLANTGCQAADTRPGRQVVAHAGAPQPEQLSQRGQVTVTTRDGRELRVAVEVASNDQERGRGLMFRTSMPELAGMFFVFPEDGIQSFWMKNTYLPLDMIFVDSGGRIVGIVENAEPRTLTSRSVDAASRYVLEVNGGWATRHGVRRGDRVRLEGMYDLC
jgi:uncharacterized membrane protein (UPF0127 family)